MASLLYFLLLSQNIYFSSLLKFFIFLFLCAYISYAHAQKETYPHICTVCVIWFIGKLILHAYSGAFINP